MTTKILTGIFSLTIVLKILFWYLSDSPISRFSILLLLFIIIVINFKSRLTWVLGLTYSLIAIVAIFLNFNLNQSESIGNNPFLFLQSIENSINTKTNSYSKFLFNIFPLILYISMFVIFLTPNFKKRYFNNK